MHMLGDLLGPTMWRPENSVNICNLLISTFPNMAKNHEISVYAFDKRDLRFMTPPPKLRNSKRAGFLMKDGIVLERCKDI